MITTATIFQRYLPNASLMILRNDTPRVLQGARAHHSAANSHCLHQVKLRYMSSSSRDIPSISFSSDQNELSRDILLERIKSSSDTSEIFESIKLHLSIMNPSHQFVALNMLFQLEKSGNSKLPKKAIVKSPEFQHLCKQLVVKIHTFRTEDVISILKCLAYFQVHSKSKVVQSCLQIIASNVNELSLSSIMFLDFLLSDITPSPLVEALKISLPIVFQAQYTNRVHTESNANLIEMLAFCTRKQLSEDLTNKLLDTLVERNDIEYTERTAKSIVMSIVHCKKPKSVHGILLKRTLMWISNNLKRFKFDDIESLTSRLINKYVWVDDIFYNEIFLNNVTEHLIENQHDFTECMYVLKKLTRIHFASKPLLEYMARQAYSDPAQLEKTSPGASITYIAALSDSDYKPPHWEMIQAYFLHNFENTFSHNDKLELPWMKIALEFASLDIYPPFLYEKIFESSFLERFVRTNNVLDYFQLLKLHQVNRTLNPSPLVNLEPPRHLVDKAVQFYLSDKREYPLRAALERGLGGSQLVLSRVFSKYYHFIDHVIAMRKGDYPIPLQSSSADSTVPVFLEDVRASLPEGHYIIAVCALPSSAFTVNTQVLRGTTRMALDSLETSCQVSVVPVNVDTWQELPEHERIPYLMQLLPKRDARTEGRNYGDVD